MKIIKKEIKKQFYQAKRVRPIFINCLETPFKFLVQANKNHGICDVICCNNNQYTRVSSALAKFQGRQYDDQDVIYQLTNFLSSYLHGNR